MKQNTTDAPEPKAATPNVSGFSYKIPDNNALPAATKAKIEVAVNEAIQEYDEVFGNENQAQEVLHWFMKWKDTATFKHLGAAWVKYAEFKYGKAAK